MAYQPLYATISDTNAERHTTSLRRRVTWIDFWLNSHLGEVCKLYSQAQIKETKRGYEVIGVNVSIRFNEQCNLDFNGNTITLKLEKEREVNNV